MKFITAAIALLACSLGLAQGGWAQVKRVNIGDVVRISAPSVSDSLILGSVYSITSNMIRLTTDSINHVWTDIPLDAIEQLELQKKVGKTGRGALIGAGVGGFLIGMITMASYEPCTREPGEWFGCIVEFSRGELFLLGAALGGASGALIGAVIGSFKKTLIWKEVQLEVTAVPMPRNYLKLASAPGLTLKWSF